MYKLKNYSRNFFIFFVITIVNNICLSSSNIEIGSIDWVNKKIHQNPELVWLLNSEVNYSFGEPNKNSWSKNLVGRNSNEFEKTLLSLMCLDLIYDGRELAYKKFISCQKSDPLSYKNFVKIHNLIRNLEKNFLNKKYIEKNLILRDIGKSRTFRNYVRTRFKYSEQDPHYFFRTLLIRYPNFCQEFFNIPKNYLNLFLDIDKFHFGHINHLEGSTEMFYDIKNSKLLSNADYFNFKKITDLLEIAGCMGHLNNNGSIILNDNVYQNSEIVYESIIQLKSKNAYDVLKLLIAKKANKLGFQINDEIDYIACRIAVMLNLKKHETFTLVKYLNKLNQKEQKLLLSNLHPLVQISKKTPTYMPGFLRELYKQSKNLVSETSIEKLSKEYLPFIAKIIKQYQVSYQNSDVVLAFNMSTKQIKEGFIVSSNTKFRIDDGIVFLINDKN